MGYYARKSIENAMSGKIDIEADIMALMEVQGTQFTEPSMEEVLEPDWRLHRSGHNGKGYDTSCMFCRDMVEEQESRWGEEREVVND
jgi:hypothetical protein